MLAMTRILAPEDFGVFALASFFFSVINLRPKAGITQAFARSKETTAELAGTHLVLDVMVGMATVLMAALLIIVLRYLGYPLEILLLILALAGMGVVDSFTTTASVMLDKALYFRDTTLVSSLVFPLSYIPAFWLALHGGGCWSLFAQTALYSVLLLIGMWWTAGRRFALLWQVRWRFNRGLAEELLRFGILVGMAGFAGVFLSQFDNFLVGTFVGVTTLGFYERAYRIAQWPSLLVGSVASRTSFYAYVRLQEDPEKLREAMILTIWLVTMLALPLAVAVFVSAPDLVTLLFGERWQLSSLFLRFLVVCSVFSPFIENANSLLIAVGHPRKSAIVLMSQAVVLVVVGTPLTLAYGAVGTCVGVAMAFAAGLALICYALKAVVSLPIKEALAKPLLAALLSVILCNLLIWCLDFDQLSLVARVAGKSCVAVASFFAAILTIQPGEAKKRYVIILQLISGRGRNTTSDEDLQDA